MSEFKTIPIAIKCEINNEGFIQTVDKKTPIFPYPLGSKKVKLTMTNGVREEFEIGALVHEAFGVKSSIPIVAMVGNRNGAVGSVGQCSEAPVVVDFDAPAVDPKKIGNLDLSNATMSIGKSSSDMETKIMALDTFTSVKIWKLHEAGIKEDRIRELVGKKNQANVSGTIKEFTKKEKLRERADKIKI